MSTEASDSSTMTAARRQYDEQGFVVFRDVIDAELLAEADAHVQWLQSRHPDLRPEHLGTKLLANDPFWVRLVADDRLLDVAEQFVGRDIALFASHYISKPPRNGLPVHWHQDAGFWPLDPMQVTTLWLAIDHSVPDNGCLRVLPGSHELSVQPMRPTEGTAGVLSSEVAVENVDESQAVDLILGPGDVSVHHPNSIHGSKANTSPRRRCGLTIRYIPTSTRITETPWPSAFLVRGRAVTGVNDYRPRPRYSAGRHMAFRGCESWK